MPWDDAVLGEQWLSAAERSRLAALSRRLPGGRRGPLLDPQGGGAEGDRHRSARARRRTRGRHRRGHRPRRRLARGRRPRSRGARRERRHPPGPLPRARRPCQTGVPMVTTTPDSPSGPGPVAADQLAGFRARCEQLTGRALSDPVALHAFSVDEPDLFWGTLLDVDGPALVRLRRHRPGRHRRRDRPLLPRRPAELRRVAAPADAAAPTTTPRRSPRVHADRPAETYTRGELRARSSGRPPRCARLGLRAATGSSRSPPTPPGSLIAALAAATARRAPSPAPRRTWARRRCSAASSSWRRAAPGPRPRGDGRPTTASPALIAGLPTLRRVVAARRRPAAGGRARPVHRLADLVAAPARRPGARTGRGCPFNHPLFIMFSSGTTGPPKCIVHGAGGTLLEHVKEHRLHGDLRPGDTLYFHTTAAWMMWNWQLSALACGAQIVALRRAAQRRRTRCGELVAEERRHRLRHQPGLPAALPGRGLLARPTRSTCSRAARGPLHRLGPARLAVRLGRRGRSGRCRCSRSPAAPTSSAASSSATPSCRSAAGRSQCRSLGLDVRRCDEDDADGLGRSASWSAATRSPRARSASSATRTAARFHDAYFAAQPGRLDARRPDRVRRRRAGADPRPLRRRPERPRHPHRPGRDLPRAARGARGRRGDGGRAARPAAGRELRGWCCWWSCAEGTGLDGGLDREIRRTIAAGRPRPTSRRWWSRSPSCR